MLVWQYYGVFWYVRGQFAECLARQKSLVNTLNSSIVSYRIVYCCVQSTGAKRRWRSDMTWHNLFKWQHNCLNCLAVWCNMMQGDAEKDSDARQNAWLYLRVLRSHPGVGVCPARHVRVATGRSSLQQRRASLPQTCRGEWVMRYDYWLVKNSVTEVLLPLNSSFDKQFKYRYAFVCIFLRTAENKMIFIFRCADD